jgi:hypothetical protein
MAQISGKLDRLEKLEELVAQQQEHNSKLEELKAMSGKLEELKAMSRELEEQNSKLEELRLQQRGLGCPSTSGQWCPPSSNTVGRVEWAAATEQQ